MVLAINHAAAALQKMQKVFNKTDDEQTAQHHLEMALNHLRGDGNENAPVSS
jgi:hypothetical protein